VRLPDPAPPLLIGHEEAFASHGLVPRREPLHAFERVISAADPIPTPDPATLELLEAPHEVAAPLPIA